MKAKQAESDLKNVANVALALPVTQASVERTFSSLRYILNDTWADRRQGNNVSALQHLTLLFAV